jgi:2-hydroxychromene-2-carboxylate isomerase
MRGLIAARHAGLGERYLEAVLTAMWESGQKIDDPSVFTAVLDATEVDGTAFLAAMQDPEVKAELMHHTEAAVRRGVFGIPTFFVGDEMFFGKERLGQVEELLQSRNAA